jgi:DNA-dependent protein kinase catalytic subunit
LIGKRNWSNEVVLGTIPLALDDLPFLQPCKIYMKPEDVQFMFNDVVQRTEQLFFSPVETMDNRMLQLPSFLAALASIVKEMGEVRNQERDFFHRSTSLISPILF